MRHLEIRKANAKDRPVLIKHSRALAAELPQSSRDPDKAELGIPAALGDPKKRCTYFVAVVDGRVVGQVMVCLVFDDLRNGWIGCIRRLYVREDFRRRGIGEALLDHVITTESKSVIDFRVDVHMSNSKSLRLFERLGGRFFAYHGVIPARRTEQPAGQRLPNMKQAGPVAQQVEETVP